jgi:integrase
MLGVTFHHNLRTSMAVSVTIWQLAPARFRLRCRITHQKDAYRFVAGSRADAEAGAAAWRAEVELHGLAPLSGTTTLGAWLAQLQTLRPDLQPRTRAFYADLVRLYFGSIAGRRMIRLTPADGVNFQRELLDRPGRRKGKGVDATTVRHCFKLAKWALGEAHRLRVIPSNPFADVRAVRGMAPDVKVPGRAHMRQIAHAADGRTGLLLRLAIASGARRNELLALTWQHVDLTEGAIAIEGALEQLGGEIRVKPPKTRAGRRTVILPPSMVAELRTARAEAGAFAMAEGRKVGDLPVFADADGVSFWSPMAASQAARRALHAAGVPGSLHGLRHAHATALLQARVNPRAVQHRLGHAHISTTLGTYDHAMPGDDAAASAAIAKAIGGNVA